MSLALTRPTAARTTLHAVAATALLIAAAHIRIPMWPVPMTMQPFAVLLIAGALSRPAAIGAVAAYLGLACAGLPVLAGATGIGGPTTGYLMSYLIVAALLPVLRDMGAMASWPARIACLTLGMVIIYACGLAWLTVHFTHNLQAAFMAGAAPFLLGDAVKILLAAICLPGTRRAI